MSDTWKQWEGQIVNGQFPLLRYLGESTHSVVFLTERHEGERLVRAAIKLIPATPENDDLQLSRWRQTAKLSHPHLLPLYEMGRCQVGGMPLLYAVMECAEENLAQVLPDRALTPAEALAMLEDVLDGLAYLHDNGFVHGHIKPANIMASDDQLKVSIDAVRRAGESLDGFRYQGPYDAPENARGIIPMPQTMSAAGDVWSLGMTLVETLTQNLPVARTAGQQDPLLPKTLPEPFLEIASHCLLRHPQGRWTIAQIAARLGVRAPLPRARIMPPPHAPVRAPQPMARTAKRRRYAVPIAVGFVLVLVAILVRPTLLHRQPGVPQVPATADERSLVPPAPREVAPPPQERPIESSRPSVAEEDQSFKAPVPLPASIQPRTIHEEETSTVVKPPEGAPVHGEVARKVMPEVLQSASNTIRGTVKVRVKVNVDRSGNVEDAELESSGPSKYFSRAALQAAQLWKFKPPKVGGRGVLSSWILQFEFTRDETTVIPAQETP